MRTYIVCSVAALALSMPLFAHGAVIINEIAWMGTPVSATDEWMELYNDGPDDVPLSGWKILAEDGAPSIPLAGAIPAGGYYLLERTDDGSVPDVSADKIYTGDLSNNGETLQLIDSTGTAVESVVGGASWAHIGGDNTTKDTPQRQSVLAWLTGIPTPKAVNTTTPSAPPDGEVAGAGTSTSETKPRKRVVTGGYKQVVFGYAGEDATGIVGAAVAFEGYAVSDKNVRLSTATYRWSFGDGGHAKGKEAAHVYEEPGTYTVVLRVYSGYQKWQDQITATILPATATLGEAKTGDHGYIEVRNDSDAELDLSGWKLAVIYARGTFPDERFVIPDATIIAPHASVRFSSRVTKLVFADEDTVVLQYPSGARAAGR